MAAINSMPNYFCFEYRCTVVFMDVDMPVMDGIMATKEIVRWAMACGYLGRVWVVGVAGFSTAEWMQMCISSGMIMAYVKPVIKPQLL